MTESRKVTMVSEFVAATPDGAPVRDSDGNVIVARHEATDYVPVDQLDEYVADANVRWQTVTVGDTHDAGPAGANPEG